MLSWRDRGRLPADMALGQRWGRLRIVGYELRPCGRYRRRYVLCVCLCGTVLYTQPGHLRTGDVQSCGCQQAAQGQQHLTRLWEEVRTGARTLQVGRPRKHHEEAA
jgi:hypothetical protein